MLTARGIDLYYGASRALRQVSLEAPVGQITCVLGRNGVGKTSLLRAIAGQLPIRSGNIALDGREIAHMAAHERARLGIALVPQGREIFPLLSVQENLETGFGVLPRGQRKVHARIFDLFPVLAQMRRRRGGDLSGGQQQQLAIARALVMRPRLLALDEPTEGIQPSIIKEIGRILELLRQEGEMAILLVEQYLDFARALADRVVVMDRGGVVLSGPLRELAEPEIRRYLTV